MADILNNSGRVQRPGGPTVMFMALVLILMPGITPLLADVQTFTHEVKQPFGGSQSPDDAVVAAIARAKFEVLEQAGTYLESHTVVQNFMVEKDEIVALAAGILKTEIISQKNFATDDAFGVVIVARVEVDSRILESRIQAMLEDRSHLASLKRLQEREKQLLQQISKLEQHGQRISRLPSAREKIDLENLRREYDRITRGLSAVELNRRALELWRNGRYSLPRDALAFLDRAITLDPEFASAYNNRGLAWLNVNSPRQALEDFDRAIELDPEFSGAIMNRGLMYEQMKQSRRAIVDFNLALRLNPQSAVAYINRGNSHGNMGNTKQAIEDYSAAIRLNPNLSLAWHNRAVAHENLFDFPKACEDYEKACELGACEGLMQAVDEGVCR